MKEKLFSPIDIGPYQLRNRVVMPAMHLGMCEDGRVSESELRFYGERAHGGVSLIIVGVCNTFDDKGPSIKGVLELSRDEHIESMGRLHRVICDGGAKSAVQLCPISGYNNPQWEVDESTLFELIESIGRAAQRAQRAGFDFVELMVSGGSLLSHLLSPHHNGGKMERYSGSLENRLRASLEAMDAIAHYAPEMPILVRMHGHEYLENGYGLNEAAAIAKAFEQHGACALNVTVAGHRTLVPQITRQRNAESFSFLGRNIKDAVNIPVLYGSRIRSLEDAQSVMAHSNADCITVGRALIADAAFVKRLQERKMSVNTFVEGAVPSSGEETAMAKDPTVNCVGCCHCLDMAFTKKPVQCTVNPNVQWGPEATSFFTKETAHVKSGDTVLIAGTGPAGLYAAITFATQGAKVVLVERTQQLGGKWRQVAGLEGHSDLQGALEGITTQLEQLGVEIVTETTVVPEYVATISPKLLVLATGASPRQVGIPGIECHPRVFHVAELLANNSVDTEVLDDRGGNWFDGAEEVVIIGGNAAGVTAALHLAKNGFASNEAIGYLHRFGNSTWAAEAAAFRPKRNITVLKRRGFFGKGMGRATRWTAVQELSMFGVNTLDKTTIDKVEKDGIWILHGKAKERKFVPADAIVLSTGFESTVAVEEFKTVVPKVLVIGDANKIGNITSAAHGLFTTVHANTSGEN